MNNNNHKIAVSLFGIILFFSFSGLALAATELARINGTTITLEDFNKKYKENLKFFQFKAPTKKGVLEDLIKRELGIQEAKKLSLDKDPDVVDKMNTVLYHALLEKKLTKEFDGIHITDADAKDFYSRYPEIRTSHIFVSVRPDATSEEDKAAREKIKKIYDEYLSGDSKKDKMSFAEVAQRFSEGIAAPMGGDIDYQTRDRLDPTYYETSLKLKTPGKISEIIRTQFGYHVIKLTALKKWEDTDKAQVKRILFEQKRTLIFEQYMTQLRQQAKVVIKNDLIQ